MKWILLVAWSTTGPVHSSNAVAMQEFDSLQACQFASIEAQKIAFRIRVVCVPKGGAA